MAEDHFSGPISSYAITPGYRVGDFYSCPMSAATATVIPYGSLRCTPILLARDVTIDQLVVEMNAAPGVSDTTGGVLRAGLYATDRDTLRPGVLLVDAGTVPAVNSTPTGAKAFAIPNQFLPAGLYWGAIVAQSLTGTSPPSLRCPASMDVFALPLASVSGNINTGYAMTASLDPAVGLPRMFSPAVTTGTPRVFVRISAN